MNILHRIFHIKHKRNILLYSRYEAFVALTAERLKKEWKVVEGVEGYRTVTRFIARTRERERETRREGVTRSSRRDERGEDFLKLHFVAPERPYTGISTPTARDNEASIGVPFMEVRDTHRWVHRRNVRPTGT